MNKKQQLMILHSYFVINQVPLCVINQVPLCVINQVPLCGGGTC